MNIIQKYQYKRFTRRDLWREARKKAKPSLWQRILEWFSNLIFGKKVEPGIVTDPTQAVLMVDLSSYQPYCDVEGLIDAGVRHFFLRMVYVGQYVMDDWRLTEDTTYRTYLLRIRAHAKLRGVTVWVGGYILYTCGVEQYNPALAKDYTDIVDLAMGGGAYRPDVLAIDDEVNRWWEGTRQITATGVNQRKGLEALRLKLWTKFKILPIYYGARWFMNQYDSSVYVDMFDALNKPVSLGGPGEQFPVWLAWYPQTWSTIFDPITDVLKALVIPTGTQTANLLAIGSYTQFVAWQFSGSLLTNYNKNAAGAVAGLDITRSADAIATFNQRLNLSAPEPPPPPPDTNPPTIPIGVGGIVTSRDVNITWTPATDDTGVAYYRVWRDDVDIAHPTGTSYDDLGLANGSYAYQIDAVDTAGNVSARSVKILLTVNVVNPPPGDGDHTEIFKRLTEIQQTIAEIRIHFS